MKSFEKKCLLTGWGMFIVSAVFFIIASIRSGDMMSLVGSLFFLFACFVFLLPLVRS